MQILETQHQTSTSHLIVQFVYNVSKGMWNQCAYTLICFAIIKRIDVISEIYASANLPNDIPLHSRVGVARLRVKISNARLACWSRTTNALPS